MKKNLAALAMTLALLTCAGAYAQTVHVESTIPFSFNVGNTQLPAGKYEIQSAGTSGHVLNIRNRDTGEGTFVVPLAHESSKASSDTKLVFHRYGKQYFMAEFWLTGYKQGQQFKAGRKETELAKDYSQQQDNTTLMASRR
jgi:hypothetical protein